MGTAMDQSTAVAPNADHSAVPASRLGAPEGFAGTDWSSGRRAWPVGTGAPLGREGPVAGEGPVTGEGPARAPTTTSGAIRALLAAGTVALVVGALVATALLAVSAWSDRRQARSADAAAAATRAQVRTVDRRLQTVEAELGRVHARSTSARATLESANRALAALRFELAGTQAQQFDQGVSIGSVQSCLGGVQSALNDIALGFPGQATAALHGVAATCAAAGASEG